MLSNGIFSLPIVNYAKFGNCLFNSMESSLEPTAFLIEVWCKGNNFAHSTIAYATILQSIIISGYRCNVEQKVII
jgi:hypothetical protein